METQKEQTGGNTEGEHPKHGIVRLAFTPTDNPEATVIAAGHLQQADPARQITRSEAMRRSTRFNLAQSEDHTTAVAWHLPPAIAQAMTTDTTGTLHVWCWSGKPQHGMFLSWLFPHVAVEAHYIDPDQHQHRVNMRMSAKGPFMLPYLAHLPADERPDYRSWNQHTHTLVWPVDAVPAVTPDPQ